MSEAARLSLTDEGTQIRPSFRSDSDMRVNLDWKSSLAGMQVGWICV